MKIVTQNDSIPAMIMALEARNIDFFQIAVFLTYDRTYTINTELCTIFNDYALNCVYLSCK